MNVFFYKLLYILLFITNVFSVNTQKIDKLYANQHDYNFCLKLSICIMYGIVHNPELKDGKLFFNMTDINDNLKTNIEKSLRNIKKIKYVTLQNWDYNDDIHNCLQTIHLNALTKYLTSLENLIENFKSHVVDYSFTKDFIEAGMEIVKSLTNCD